jgi:hypothetical protein
VPNGWWNHAAVGSKRDAAPEDEEMLFAGRVWTGCHESRWALHRGSDLRSMCRLQQDSSSGKLLPAAALNDVTSAIEMRADATTLTFIAVPKLVELGARSARVPMRCCNGYDGGRRDAAAADRAGYDEAFGCAPAEPARGLRNGPPERAGCRAPRGRSALGLGSAAIGLGFVNVNSHSDIRTPPIRHPCDPIVRRRGMQGGLITGRCSPRSRTNGKSRATTTSDTRTIRSDTGAAPMPVGSPMGAEIARSFRTFRKSHMNRVLAANLRMG